MMMTSKTWIQRTAIIAVALLCAAPTGRIYIEQSPTVMADPDVKAWMGALMTRSMQRLSEQMATLKAEIAAAAKKTGS